MKICFVNTNKEWGGGEKWHYEMAINMQKHGYDVCFIAHPNGEITPKLEGSGINIQKLKIGNLSFLDPLKIRKAFSLMKKMQPDVMILNMPADLKCIGRAARMAGIKNIVYRRGSAIPVRNNRLNRYLFKNVVTAIIANSEETKKTILQNNTELFEADKIRVIYNGIDLESFSKRKHIPVIAEKRKGIILGNAARLSRQKGHEMLFETAKILKDKGLDYHLYLAGDGEKEAELKRLCNKMNLQDNISFLGFVTNIKSFMQDIDIFLLTSEWEGFGYVLAEAMACKKPSIAFDVSSNPELIKDDENGFLVEAFNTTGFAEKVISLANDNTLRERMGKKGFEILNKKFTMDRSVQEFIRFISELTAK